MVKTAVSIPDELFKEADALAKRLGKPRSELYADALRDHLRRQGDASITRRLDEVYADRELEPGERAWLDAAATATAARNEW